MLRSSINKFSSRKKGQKTKWKTIFCTAIYCGIIKIRDDSIFRAIWKFLGSPLKICSYSTKTKFGTVLLFCFHSKPWNYIPTNKQNTPTIRKLTRTNLNNSPKTFKSYWLSLCANGNNLHIKYFGNGIQPFVFDY